MPPNLLELLPLAKKLNEANQVLLKKEAVLKQLSLFQNVAHSFEATSKLFEVETRILPGMTSETFLVKLRNTSDIFSFDPQFWSLMTCFPNGKVTHWKFDKTFRVGDYEQFSASFQPIFDSDTVYEFIIRLIFSIQWNELNYTKTFLIQSIPVDILHFLSAGRRLPTNPYTRISAETNSSSYPLCSKFSICTNVKFRAMFLEQVLFKNVELSRGFDVETAIKTFQATGDFVVYYYDEKITITIEEDNFLCFRCSNSTILLCVKKACYTRLLTLCKNSVMRIQCAQSTTELAQKLYEINLSLEALSTSSDMDFIQLLGYYHILREQTESLLVFTAEN
ncbi:unnamed protein product [Allacma fusca]|uniref:Uncharacterized protein n=1 Tax=Allacma fusca TaxID=39272 RepID=A0A8J2LT68_9HEXA|nr:unnamed protein product [Allacma fusca]